MKAGLLATSRPVPRRRPSVIAGAGLVAVALPVFLVAGWPVRGWALAAVLWLAGEALGFWLSKIPTGADNLASSGLVGIATAVRGIGAMIVLLAVTVANREVGIAAVAVYAVAYTLSLAVSLLEYFTGDRLT